MRHWAHIVTLVDTSECAAVALRIGEMLARAYGAQLHSSHIVERLSPLLHKVFFPYAALGEDLTEFEVELIAQARSELKKALYRNSSEAGPHPSSVVCDRLADGLVKELARVETDLVVMGARGEGSTEFAHLGSVSRAVLEHWGGPILFARQASTSKPVERIAVATDFAQGTDSLIATAYELAYRSKLPLAVLTVMHDPRTEERGGLLKGLVKVDARTFLSKGKKTSRGHLERIVKNLSFPYPERETLSKMEPELIVRFGDAPQQIQDFAAEYDGLLLIVGREISDGAPPPVLGRTVETLVRQVPAHILLVPLEHKSEAAPSRQAKPEQPEAG